MLVELWHYSSIAATELTRVALEKNVPAVSQAGNSFPRPHSLRLVPMAPLHGTLDSVVMLA